MHLKNIPHEQTLALTSLVDAKPEQVVSKTLAQNDAASITLFSFAKRRRASDARITVLEETGRFTVSGTEHAVTAGQALVMSANAPHAMYASEDFKMMLTAVFRGQEERA